MGPNGAGKSTLAQSIMGQPNYRVAAEKLTFNNKNLLKLDPQERAGLGIFLSFQQAVEIPGLRVYSYLRLLYNNSHREKLSPPKFRAWLKEKLDLLQLNESYLQRSLNDGFSGGEKKKMEMLQMLVLEPRLVVLDEIDSGLDVDAIKVVAKAINYLREQHKSSFLIITHYARILKYLEIDRVHLMEQGQLIRSGGSELVSSVEERGFAQAKN